MGINLSATASDHLYGGTSRFSGLETGCEFLASFLIWVILFTSACIEARRWKFYTEKCSRAANLYTPFPF